MPRKKKKFDKKNARTYHVVSGSHVDGNILESQPEDIEDDYMTVTTKGGTRRYAKTTRRVAHILGEDPYTDSYANPVADRSLRKYLKPIGNDHRGVFVSTEGSVVAAKKLKKIARAKVSKETNFEDMGEGVALRIIPEESASRSSRAQTGGAAARDGGGDDDKAGESDEDFLPAYSDVDSDEVEYRTDAIALKEAADREIAQQLDDDFDSDAMEEFGELQDDFITFALAPEEQHPRLVEDEEHLRVAADFETKRKELMKQTGLLDAGEDGDEDEDDRDGDFDGEDIPFGFGAAESDDEGEERAAAAAARRAGEGEAGGEGEGEGEEQEVHDFSDVVGAAERYRKRMVDEHFQVAVRREYDDEEEWGEIGEEDLQGGGINPESDMFNELMDEFMEQPEENMKLYKTSKDVTAEDLEKGRRVALQHGAVDLPDISEEEYFNRPKRNNWDCATIVSTYSNLENHPSVIDGDDMSGVIVLSEKTGLPIFDAKKKKKKKKKYQQQQTLDEEEEEEGEDGEAYTDESDDETVMTMMSTASVSVRVKGETAQEKRERKAAVKAARREARAAKKQVKEMYKKEGLRVDQAKARNARNMGGKSQFSYSSKQAKR